MSDTCPRCGDARMLLPTPSCPDAFHEWTPRERRQLAAEARHDGRHDEARAWLAANSEPNDGPEPSCPDAFHEWTPRERRQLAAEARNAGDATRAWLAANA